MIYRLIYLFRKINWITRLHILIKYINGTNVTKEKFFSIAVLGCETKKF